MGTFYHSPGGSYIFAIRKPTRILRIQPLSEHRGYLRLFYTHVPRRRHEDMKKGSRLSTTPFFCQRFPFQRMASSVSTSKNLALSMLGIRLIFSSMAGMTVPSILPMTLAVLVAM